MLFVILYIENSDKARFYDVKKRVKNDYVLNNAEYPGTVTVVHSLLMFLLDRYMCPNGLLIVRR